MYKKTCCICNGDSYSAAAQGKWICPYCQADLTEVSEKPAGCTGPNIEQFENKKVLSLLDKKLK